MIRVAGASRLQSIDWLRGAAVVCMVLWHAVDAWHLAEGRETGAFALVVFFGGWAAPAFLFLSGLSLALAAEGRVARGVSRADVARRFSRRGWQIVLLVHLFRLQSFLLNPYASWSSLFKSDILNVLGLGLVLAGWAWRRADSIRGRLVWLLLPAAIAALVLTPWAPSWSWPAALPSRLEGYVRIANGNAVFSLFPALAYVFAGTFVGTRVAAAASTPAGRLRLVVGGTCLAAAAWLWGRVPIPEAALAWTAPAAIVALRVGTLLAVLGLASWRLDTRPARNESPLLTFGRTSLFVYWVHVELAYGVFSRTWHGSLNLTEALAGWLLLMAGLYAAARWWLMRREAGLIPMHLKAPRPGPAAGRAGPVAVSRPVARVA